MASARISRSLSSEKSRMAAIWRAPPPRQAGSEMTRLRRSCDCGGAAVPPASMAAYNPAMPFDTRDLATGLPTDTPAERRNRRIVSIWLFSICGMIWVMIVLGGATRLSGSGLSIMRWAPLSHADWERLFNLYKQIPQYALLHPGMGLGGFKGLFWLEWVHRLFGRLIGVAFLLPLVWLWASGRIERGLRPRLAGLFVLGGLQGALGWFMVASGFFPNTTAVSQYRLVAHLVLALILFGATLWTGLSVLQPAPVHLDWAGARATRRLANATV